MMLRDKRDIFDVRCTHSAGDGISSSALGTRWLLMAILTLTLLLYSLCVLDTFRAAETNNARCEIAETGCVLICVDGFIFIISSILLFGFLNAGG